MQNIIDRLTVVGLAPQEAAVYVHLNMMGASKASDIAAALKLHRTEAYRILQNLVQQGFATSTLSRPIRFEAAPPEKLFSEILSAQEAKFESITRAKNELASSLATLRTPMETNVSRNTFKILQGRREIYGVMERLLRDARSEARFLSTHEGGFGMASMAGTWDVLADRAQQGLAARVLLAPAPETRVKLAQVAGVPPIEIREYDVDRTLQFVIGDDRQLLLWVVADPSTRLSSDKDTAIWTDATEFVGTLRTLFDTAWDHASQPLQTSPPASRTMASGKGR
ncbi:MAG TPA: helix-turn-helix domain-containing protein [Candidatus Thermoplasmatota archaeon]|nr:helix-turn-helix domain-containing protein [Candidatus Thermoplasmatota archaeon]